MQSIEWRAVPGFEGRYEVSNDGQVRSLGRLHGRVMKHWVRDSGHYIVTLCRSGRRYQRYVHVLVLEAFVGPRPSGAFGCHNDGVPAHNSVSNLRWDTPQANSLDTVKHGAHVNANKTRCPRGHLLSEPNLVRSQLLKGARSCRACSQAWSVANSHGWAFDPRVADDKYGVIMQSAM